MLSRIFLILLAIASPYGAFKIVRPCGALQASRSLRVESMENFGLRKADFDRAKLKLTAEHKSLDLESQKSNSKSKGLFRIAIASSIMLTAAFGLQQSASAAGIVDLIQERASTSGFLQAFLLIFVSEIGDKTFFIAALLAAKYSRFISFTGSIGALAVMTVISTVIGQLFHVVPPSLTNGVPYDDYIAGKFNDIYLFTICI